MHRAKRIIIAATVAATFWTPTTAAASSATQGYEPPGGRVQVETHRHGTLPFTGMDISLAGIAGVVLVGMGVGIRRLSRPEPR